MTEIWKPVPEFEDRYEVSSLGRVRSLRRRGHGYDNKRKKPLILKQTINSNDGYYYVRLGRDAMKKVHRLVCSSFYGECPSNMETSHLDGDKLNNDKNNLQWVTKLENESHKYLHRTNPRGERNGHSKLTEKIIREIRQNYKGRRGEAIKYAKKYNVCVCTISLIGRRKIWKHI